MWQDGVWTCAPNVVNTKDYCAPQIWYDTAGQPDGVIIFVRINCLTREPLGPEVQDPIYNSKFPRLLLHQPSLRCIIVSKQNKKQKLDLANFDAAVPGVPLDRGTLTTILQSWVVDTCSASVVSNNADGTQTGSFEIHGKGFSDTQLGDNGANLNAGLTSCGTLASWAFNWTPNNGTYDWSATGTIKGKSFKGCIGDAVVAAGGSTKDGCNTGPLLSPGAKSTSTLSSSPTHSV